MKIMLYLAFIIGLITYNLWGFFPKGFFYIGNSLFITIIIVYLYKKEKDSFIIFMLFCCSINNLLDELFFNPVVIGCNEWFLAAICPLFWIAKKKYHV